MPVSRLLQVRKGDPHILPVDVERQVNQVVPPLFAVIAGEADPDGSRIRSRALSLRRVRSVYPDGFQAADRTGKLFPDGRMGQTVTDHEPEKCKQLPVLFQQPPVQPGNLIVLAVGVVVSILGVAKFVPGQEHGRTPAAQKYGAGVPDQAEAQGKHLFFLRLPLRPAVPAPVVIRSVGIVPAVGLIMLFIVGIQIIQGKAIVTGEEIHAGIIPRIVPDPSAVFSIFLLFLSSCSVQVEGTGDPHGSVFRLPEIPL